VRLMVTASQPVTAGEAHRAIKRLTVVFGPSVLKDKVPKEKKMKDSQKARQLGQIVAKIGACTLLKKSLGKNLSG